MYGHTRYVPSPGPTAVAAAHRAGPVRTSTCTARVTKNFGKGVPFFSPRDWFRTCCVERLREGGGGLERRLAHTTIRQRAPTHLSLMMVARRGLAALGEASRASRTDWAASSSSASIATRSLSTSRPRALPRRVSRRSGGGSNVQESCPDDAGSADKWSYDSPYVAKKAARPPPPQPQPHTHSALSFPKPAPRTPAESSHVPWYLRGKAAEHDVKGADAGSFQEEEDVITVPYELQGMSLTPNIELPPALQGLHELLTEGMSSALIARPDEVDENGRAIEGASGRPPIHYIHARAHDNEAWTEWVVVVQVRSSAGGSVSRVAREVGGYLRRAMPPAPTGGAEAFPSSLDDYLGPVEDADAAITSPGATNQGGRGRTDQEDSDAAAAKQPLAPASRPWRPRKILSREAQQGMRLLNKHDPERWTREALATTFHLSQESVRRILKSKWQPTSAAVTRQNRRAREREIERREQYVARAAAEAESGEAGGAPATTGRWALEMREEDEVARIREMIQASATEDGRTQSTPSEDSENEDGDAAVDDVLLARQDGEEGADPMLYAAAEDGTEEHHLQPVFYEGLVATPSAAGSTASSGRPSGTLAASRAKSGLQRGDGEWCLVDADWCVVHVMSARARNTYDVERAYDER